MMFSTFRKVLLLLAVGSAGCCARAAEAPRAGAWWTSASLDERTGYVAGYLECSLYDAGKSDLRRVRWILLEKTISERYANGSEPLTAPVGGLVVKLGALQPRPPLDPAAETQTQKYGIFDGEWWRQVSTESRLGFVEGYRDCWRTERVPGATYSKPAVSYVSEISGWYGVRDDDESEIDARRSDDKIPVVLRRFRDRP